MCWNHPILQRIYDNILYKIENYWLFSILGQFQYDLCDSYNLKKKLEFFHDTLCYNIDIRLINEKQDDDNSEDLNVLDCKSDNEGMDASTDKEEAALDKLHQ